MILVIGSVIVRDEHLDEAVQLSIDHVHRSRDEPGCISHDVHRDAENPRRLVFVERWADQPALMQHFSLEESNAFVRAVSALAEQAPSIEIFDATDVDGMLA